MRYIPIWGLCKFYICRDCREVCIVIGPNTKFLGSGTLPDIYDCIVISRVLWRFRQLLLYQGHTYLVPVFNVDPSLSAVWVYSVVCRSSRLGTETIIWSTWLKFTTGENSEHIGLAYYQDLENGFRIDFQWIGPEYPSWISLLNIPPIHCRN